MQKLTHFRAMCVPIAHPVRSTADVWFFSTKMAADEHAAPLIAGLRRDTSALHARPP